MKLRRESFLNLRPPPVISRRFRQHISLGRVLKSSVGLDSMAELYLSDLIENGNISKA
jgi:hypothetical protein